MSLPLSKRNVARYFINSVIKNYTPKRKKNAIAYKYINIALHLALIVCIK